MKSPGIVWLTFHEKFCITTRGQQKVHPIIIDKHLKSLNNTHNKQNLKSSARTFTSNMHQKHPNINSQTAIPSHTIPYNSWKFFPRSLRPLTPPTLEDHQAHPPTHSPPIHLYGIVWDIEGIRCPFEVSIGQAPFFGTKKSGEKLMAIYIVMEIGGNFRRNWTNWTDLLKAGTEGTNWKWMIQSERRLTKQNIPLNL